MTAYRCLACDVVFTTITAYTHPSHLCSGTHRDTANASPAVEQTITASPASPLADAVIVPLFRPTWAAPVKPCPA